MAKDLTKLYSRPGAEAFHVFEDDSGQVQVKMGDRTAVTAVPSGTGVALSGRSPLSFSGRLQPYPQTASGVTVTQGAQEATAGALAAVSAIAGSVIHALSPYVTVDFSTVYECIVENTGSSTNRPDTGADKLTYWRVADPKYLPLALIYRTGQRYSPGGIAAFLTPAGRGGTSGAARDYYLIQSAGAWYTCDMLKVAFVTSCTDFELCVGSAGSSWQIYADGQPVQYTPVQDVDSSSKQYLIRIQFAEARARTIECVGSSQLYHIRALPTARFLPARKLLAQPVILHVGDSLNLNTLAGSRPRAIPERVARRLGMRSIPISMGGSGWVTVGPVSGIAKRTFTDWLIENDGIGLHSPSLIVLQGSINDSTATPAQVTASLSRALDYIAGRVPTVIVGPLGAVGVTPNAANVANDAAMSALCASRGVPYVSPLQERWITGTGKVGATTGDGFADVAVGTDGIHFTLEGYDFCGDMIADAIARELAFG